MAVYMIGDLHLSLGGDKAMDIFPGWSGYVDKIKQHWNQVVGGNDTVVVAGDTSWGMNLEESLPDFAFLHNLPGKKIFLKGNHDYWWSTKSKMEAFFTTHGFDDFSVLHNNFFEVEDFLICGSRGWLFEQGDIQDQKVIAREAGRLRTSLEAAKGSGLEKEIVVFLHYPPVYGEQTSPQMLDLLLQYNVKRCFYGHIHGHGCAQALEGDYMGTTYKLISADHLRFCPIRLEKQ